MNSDAAFSTLLRALPALLVFALGFLATNDLRTRRQWTQFLYSVGSLRADQREDEAKQKSVKWPFFVVALLMLWWPLYNYRHATRTFEVASKSDLFKKSQTAATPAPTATPKPAPTGPTPPPAPPRPGEAAPPSAAPNAVPAAPSATKTPAPNVSGSGPRL